jgi:hypothetical protein
MDINKLTKKELISIIESQAKLSQQQGSTIVKQYDLMQKILKEFKKANKAWLITYYIGGILGIILGLIIGGLL